MDFLTTAQVAEIWKISQRRVDILCKEGRIAGAVMIGNRWFLPMGTEKPKDKRKVKHEKFMR